MKLDRAALTLMPMHLHVDAAGRVLSAGSTLRRIVGDIADFHAAFEPVGPVADASLPQLAQVERVFLRSRADPAQVLRGRAVGLDDGGLVFSLGLGIGLVETIRRHDLTDREFAPSDLAMEFLFLHEANNAMLDELSQANLRLEKARRRAEAQAFTDPLTGLNNRRGLHLAFEALRQGTGPATAGQFALIAMDLDRFKELNDSRGHAVGDAMLCEVAARLRAITRSCDTIARTGGDEFVLLLPGIPDPTALEQLGRRIIRKIEAPARLDGAVSRISASLGVAISSRYLRIDWGRMQADADAALYQAKRTGRGNICISLGDRGDADEGQGDGGC